MAQEYYNLQKAAEVLGIPPADLHLIREKNELRAYRDGADWKFKVEDVQAKLAEMIKAKDGPAESDMFSEEADDVLLSEAALGESGPGASGSVIGGELDAPAVQSDSDLKLIESSTDPGDADDEYPIAGENGDAADMNVTIAVEEAEVDMDATVPDDDDDLDQVIGGSNADLDMTIDQNATLKDGQDDDMVDELASSSGSSIDLSDALDDDNLVLGGSSGSGSDITIGGDSGISLVDPADSGLSLEDPIDLVEGSGESLELGEDDMLVFTGEEADGESPTELKTDDDFLLTPMDDDSTDDDSESGSQVIALDEAAEGDEGATMIGSASGIGMAAMLDEDFSTDETTEVRAAPFGATAATMEPEFDVTAGAQQMEAGAVPATAGVSAVVLPEAPYSIWNVLSLALCAIFLMLTGMMLYDLLRNMWSWNGSYELNSTLMDAILDMVGR